MMRFNVRLKTDRNSQFNLVHRAKLKKNYRKLRKGREAKYVIIGELRNNQNEKNWGAIHVRGEVRRRKLRKEENL